MGYSADSHPHIGCVPGQQNQYVNAGFNGHGMPVIWATSRGVAQMLLHGSDFSDTGIPRLFESTRERIERVSRGPEGGDIFSKTGLKDSNALNATATALHVEEGKAGL